MRQVQGLSAGGCGGDFGVTYDPGEYLQIAYERPGNFLSGRE
jgi:hypothetical protein